MKSIELRNSFLNFFEKNKHKILPGSSIIPANDNSILFTNAGMNQFKDIFLGIESVNYNSAATSQRCIRAGGKHNDLQNVGFTARHLTCFEMLGNFSFGSYFKEEAIFYAWNLLTDVFKFDPNILWVTVFKDDNEAFEIWNKKIGIDSSKIIRLGEKDNFWQMGDIGPCGPCSEIYVDQGIKEEIDKKALPGDDYSKRFIEIWNLVFMQFNRDKSGVFNPLNRRGIDTGMGLERLAMVKQGVSNVYETDAFLEIIKSIEKLSGKNYLDSNKASFNVMADHIRSSCSIISEGIIPSNEGRGYVLRKIIRRALLFTNKIGNLNIFSNLVKEFLSNELALYSDLKKHINFIENTIIDETERFAVNLSGGSKRFYEMTKGEKNNNFSGKNAFILYDTYGFPLEITEILANEQNRIIDLNEYDSLMNEQRERSRGEKNLKIEDFKIDEINEKTKFLGYESLFSDSKVLKIIENGNFVEESSSEKEIILIFDKSPLYPGGGGQVFDKGFILKDGIKSSVLRIKKKEGTIDSENTVLIYIDSRSNFKIGDDVKIFVDEDKRRVTCAHHTSAHLLQAALKNHFGDYVKQEGSSVSEKEMTFDFSISFLPSKDDISKIEREVNLNIRKNLDVSISNMSFDEAVKSGTIAVFTEKYNKDNVRVVSIGDISKELCGGTHVNKTGEIGLFIIKEVKTVSSGTKRFVCLASDRAYDEYEKWKDVISYSISSFKCQSQDIVENLNKQIENLNNSKKEVICLKQSLVENLSKNWIDEQSNNFGILNLNSNLKDFFRNAMDLMQAKKPGFYILLSESENGLNVFLEINKNILNKYNLDLIKNIFVEKYEFKGRFNNNIAQGIIKNKNINDLNKLFI
jgi:alanyl-tRNA synthetase